MVRTSSLRFGWVVVAVALAACGDDGSGGDGGPGLDAEMMDGATSDAGPRTDAGPPPDAGSDDGGGADATVDGGGDDGGGDDAGAADAGPPAPACMGVDPTVTSALVDTSITVLGVTLHDGATVLLRGLDGGDPLDLGAPTIASGGSSATVTLAMGAAAPGFYAVVYVLSDDTELVCGEIQVTNLPPPTVTDVSPDTAWHGLAGDGVLSDRTVTVTGTGFLNTPSVTFASRDDAAFRVNALSVNWVSGTELTAVVPSESRSMPAGEYDVLVTNPDGLSAQWTLPDGTPGTFTITDTAPPTILSITPLRSPSAADVTLVVDGLDFQPGAVVSLEPPDGTRLDLATDNDPDMPANRLSAFIPSGSLSNVLHAVWVTNPDGQSDVFFAYRATSSSAGHLDSFTPASVSLLDARWRHATEIGFDPFARSYLYVVGGIGADGEVLGNTEILEISGLGEPAPPRYSVQWESAAAPRVHNELATARAGHTVVRAGRFLYAVGGASTDTHVAAPPDAALDTIERAKILDFDEQPQIQLPRARGADGLPVGTWYYQVSAIGPWGESLPSREEQVLRRGGTVDVCWARVAGATSYNLYRSVASDGRAGTTRLLLSGIDGRCTTDTGRDEMQPAPGRLRGAPSAGGGLDAGFHGYRVTAVVDGRETLAGYRAFVGVEAGPDMQVALRWDPVPDATYNLYRTEGALTAPAGDEATYLLAEGLDARTYVDDGSVAVTLDRPAPDGLRPLPPGSISTWAPLTRRLNVPREGVDAVVLTVPSGDADVEDRTMMYVVGGRRGSAAATAYESTTEYAEIDTETGALGAFTLDDELLDVPRGFYVLLTNIGQRSARRPPPPEELPCADRDGDGELVPDCMGCDCDDTDPTIHCGAEEICGDGIDQDCDGADLDCRCPVDADEDGFDIPECGGCDCNDDDPAIHCEADEICGDDVDQDCDGADELCDCPVDSDGDGEDVPGCDGCDCNDDDPTIRCGIDETCADTPELCDDGVDQNCDGEDCTCLILFSGELPPGFVPWSAPRFEPAYSEHVTLPLAPISAPRFPGGGAHSVATGPVLLIAVAGDDQYAERGGGGNAGLTSVEVAEISTAPDETNGSLLGWSLQAEELPAGRRTLGLDALLYFDFLFVFPGVGGEVRSTGSIDPLGSTTARFAFDEAGAGAAYTERFESTSASFVTARAYYSTTRLNGGLFLVGGHDGVGALRSIERAVP